MKFISHRGNVTESVPELENHPDYISNALNLGYDVEIDVWCINEEYFLGHEQPKHKISLDFLQHKSLWLHLKNIEAVISLSKVKNLHWFWHENDKITITSRGYILSLVGTLVSGTIVNQPYNSDFLDNDIMYQGVLADNINELRNKYDEKKLFTHYRCNPTNSK